MWSFIGRIMINKKLALIVVIIIFSQECFNLIKSIVELSISTIIVSMT